MRGSKLRNGSASPFRPSPAQLRFASPSNPHSVSSPRLPFALSSDCFTHSFYLFKNRTPRFAAVTFALSDSLRELRIVRLTDPKREKTVLLEEVAVEKDFSMELRRALVEAGFNCRLYGFRLQTRSKSFEIGSESLEFRDRWLQTLTVLRTALSDLSRPDVLKRYLALVCKADDIDQIASSCGLTKRMLIEKAREVKAELRETNREVTELVLNDIVTQAEIGEEREKIERMNGNLEKLVEYYRGEIVEIKEELRKKRRDSFAAQKVWARHQKRNRPIAWKAVFEFLTYGEITQCSGTSREFLRVRSSLLSRRSFWEALNARSIEPRSRSWPAFCQQFTPDLKLLPDSALSLDETKQIQGDVERCDFSASVATILTSLCSKYPEVGYCQGMHLTTEFLLTVLQDDYSTLSLLMRLMNSPYFLSEVWKPGLPRVKLVMYQLEFLLNLKLPALASHFQTLELPLEVVVAPWILTLFTQLVGTTQSRMPRQALLAIWDRFLIRGWPALLAVSLCLLSSCESKRYSANIIGKSLEVTMECMHKDLEIDFGTALGRYEAMEPSEELLKDLEKGFQVLGNREEIQ